MILIQRRAKSRRLWIIKNTMAPLNKRESPEATECQRILCN